MRFSLKFLPKRSISPNKIVLKSLNEFRFKNNLIFTDQISLDEL